MLVHDENFFEIEPEAETHAHRVEYAQARHELAVQMLKRVRESLTHVIQLLETGDHARATRQLVDLVLTNKSTQASFESQTGSRVIEGIFDGVCMVGADGVRYDVPHNYSSKSRLVEGDILKLTVQPDGSYVYKQIGPVERQRIIGKLHIDPATQEPVVQVGERVYKVLTASVSYYKGVPGDEIVLLVPRVGDSRWGAVENIVED